MNYFVTAIGTDSGKTLVSAILTEMLEADYWKPVQSGQPRDTETVQSLISNVKSSFHKEAYLLNTPASPHASARIDNVEIELSQIKSPTTEKDLVIEGAGGILVPLNDRDYVIDITKQVPSRLILVSNLYLGSINHTLLSVNYLQQHNFDVKGIIFNGPSNPESERIILHKSGWPCLLRIPQEDEIDQAVVKKYAEVLRENWNE
jgi:dethiobiotin synthetase